MVELADAETDAALARGRELLAYEPRAAAVRYDQHLARIVVDLTNGCSFAFPPRLVQELETASDDQLAAVEIAGLGFGLHWTELDADLCVPALLAGLFGTRAQAAPRAQSSPWPAKLAAARAKGDKPR